MRFGMYLLALLCAAGTGSVHAQQASLSFKANVTVADELQATFHPDGRLFLFLSHNQWAEPRTQTWPGPWNQGEFFGVNMEGIDPEGAIVLDPFLEWSGTAGWTLDRVPAGEYRVQVLWDQDREESGINAPGNLYSSVSTVHLDEGVELNITLDKRIGERKVTDHPLIREVDLVSDTLSAWWGRPVHLKASVLLPGDYSESGNQSYPVRYNVAGYGGRYTRINQLSGDAGFMNWWTSAEAPRVINVFLDGEGPFGDSYQMDSENSGPYGYSLIHELIPYIESTFGGAGDPGLRFVDGCSTGGWVSLALQLYYPEQFNGAFSYSPDAVNFDNYQLVNIYRDENAFTNEFGFVRPIMRDIYGEPMVSWQDFVQFENVLGASNNYLTSGGQIGSHTALYSPKGAHGLPQPLIDPESGAIDHSVAEHWKKYDLKLYCQEHWDELGPKLQGKIYIWMGDMDHFYLNIATRAFADFIEQTEDPGSDAEIVFSPMEGHCSGYSHREVLEKIQERLDQLQSK